MVNPEVLAMAKVVLLINTVIENRTDMKLETLISCDGTTEGLILHIPGVDEHVIIVPENWSGENNCNTRISFKYSSARDGIIETDGFEIGAELHLNKIVAEAICYIDEHKATAA